MKTANGDYMVIIGNPEDEPFDGNLVISGIDGVTASSTVTDLVTGQTKSIVQINGKLVVNCNIIPGMFRAFEIIP